MYRLLNFILLLGLIAGCTGSQTAQSTVHFDKSIVSPSVQITDYPTPGAQDFDSYLPLLEDKRIGLIVNKASQVDGQHLVDALLSREVNVQSIFAPEHGFRGDADAGEQIDSERDSKTNLPIYSLYGKTKKPSAEWLKDIDVLVFDLQDVGVRFYTYLSTLHYIMEAAAENGKEVILLDRPNPNGFYVAGPVLEEQYQSFVGLHPVPIVTGMTIGEYGQMINGEGWLKGGVRCQLKVIKCPTYQHHMTFELPVSPSPNLPNHRSVLLYPSLCLFEGSTVSVGRGTEAPFQQIGHPLLNDYDHSFVPKSGYGSKSPKHESKYCFGINFQQLSLEAIIEQELDLSYLVSFKSQIDAAGGTFFNTNNFFEKLAGTRIVRDGLESGADSNTMKAGWSDQVSQFKAIRMKYLLYP